MDDASARLERLLGCAVLDMRSAGSQHGVRHYRLTLADGRAAFAKLAREGADAARAGFGAEGWGAGGFGAEASGLRWLAEAGAAAVPAVLGSDDRCLVLAWIAEETAGRPAAARFGRELAALHASGADAFGAPWPGVIAGLPLPNARGPSWPEWYAGQRVLPYLRLARDAGTLTQADAVVFESAADRVAAAAGPLEPPSRIHGDLWSGNLLWSGGRGWLIDPAAHGGHRETDLAMLALFGAPYLDQILTSYQEVAPLAEGWRQRVPLHQLHPLLVHVCLFGYAYRESALSAARSIIRLAS